MRKNIIIIVLSVLLLISSIVNIIFINDNNKNVEQIYVQISEFNSLLNSYSESNSNQDYNSAVVALDKAIMLIELEFSDEHVSKKKIDQLYLLLSYLQSDRDFTDTNLNSVLTISLKLYKNIDDLDAYALIYQLRSLQENN